uniref:Uncharacterized protein n=1 Tax=Rhizophora mucronata TaxID=61149 RepID=A0A2P2P7U8_RHIMU
MPSAHLTHQWIFEVLVVWLHDAFPNPIKSFIFKQWNLKFPCDTAGGCSS